MFERFTKSSRRVVVLAQEEARKLIHNYVGTEHMLLGLVQDEGIGGKALADVGATRENLVEAIVEIIGRGNTLQGGHIPFAPRSRQVLEETLKIELNAGHSYIGPEHLVLGLLANPKSVAVQVLIRAGVDLEALHTRVLDLMDEEQDRKNPESETDHGFVLSA